MLLLARPRRLVRDEKSWADHGFAAPRTDRPPLSTGSAVDQVRVCALVLLGAAFVSVINSRVCFLGDWTGLRHGSRQQCNTRDCRQELGVEVLRYGVDAAQVAVACRHAARGHEVRVVTERCSEDSARTLCC